LQKRADKIIIHRAMKKVAKRIKDRIAVSIASAVDAMLAKRFASIEAAQQKILLHQLDARAGEKVDLASFGFSAYSQTDEDGLLLAVFAVLGMGGRLCVEICAGAGNECNSANLLLHHGWHGLLVDGNADNVAAGRRFFARHPGTAAFPPVYLQAWVTRENVNDLAASAGFTGEIDLLSLDMDGMDYWIWEALTVVQPRVVILEYSDILGPDRSVTVPYDPQFCAYKHPTTNGLPNYCGASLRAFAKLGAKKGYRLVGCNTLNFNAIFVRNPLGEAVLPRIEVEECFKHPKARWGIKSRYPEVANLPWHEV
jgi:hypothetical protein